MRRIQLYIENQRVDLFKDESVQLTQTIKNVKDIAKVFTEFTQTFSVPASSVNNKIFQHYYNSNIDFGFDARIKANAKIELNDLPFKEGKISLQGVELKNNLAHTYKITFFGNTVNLKDVLGDAQLSSLAFNGLNKLYNFQSVTDLMDVSAISPSDIIIVPFITHTNRLIYDSSNPSNLPENTSNLYSSSAGVQWNQFKYALRVQNIINQIQFAYPELQFSDHFFNDPNNEKWYDLFMWLHRKSGSVEPASEIVPVQNKLTSLNVAPTSDEYVSTVSGGVVRVQIQPAEVFQYPTLKRIILNCTPTDLTKVYQYQVIQSNGVILYSSNATGAVVNRIITSQYLNNRTYFLQFSSPNAITFNAGSIKLDFEWEYGGFPLPENPEVTGVDKYQNEFLFNVQSTNFEFNIIEQIPKMKIIDFLSGIFNMFNLTAYVDDAGTLVVRTLDSYYADSTTVYNIDKYLDTTKSTVDIALPFKEINFSYKGLGTFLAKQYEQLYNKGWGSLSYSLDGEIFDATSEAYKIELPFEHMMYERLYDINPALFGTQTPTEIQYGYSVNENQQPYIGEPLLFYPVITSTDPLPPKIIDTTSTDTVELTNTIIPSNTLTVLPTSKESLHFQLELSEFWAGYDGQSGQYANDFTDTLFETEYKTYIQDVFNLRRRLVKVTAYLPMKVYYNLQLNDLIELGQSRYKINSMKTDLTTGKTEFELLNTIL